MAAKIVNLPGIPDPNIDQILEEFLAEQRERLKSKTQKKYEEVIRLLREHLNGFAHEGLSEAESALFEKYYNAEEETHREFCQLFGPDKIIENLGSFLSFFMIRKVVAGADLKRAAGTVMKKLSKWLVEKGHISDEAARQGEEEGGEAAQDLPRAERAAQILCESVDNLSVDLEDLEEEDNLDFDHYTIAKVEPGKIWLEIVEHGEVKTLGPVPAPKRATELLQSGWEISCALGRIRGKWQIVEMANVYPL